MTFTPDDQDGLASPTDTDRVDSTVSTLGTQRRQFPHHPIAQLQGPFEESILEADEEGGDKWVVELDAQARRRDLLEKSEYERLCGRKWRQRPGERYHPFWKLISNMSFGVYLLSTGQAKSEAEVLRILQSYVDELDEFIERSTEDFFIIQLDIRTRIQYLSLPLGNLDIFDEMLDDRSFRLAMMDYNEQIEHAVERFAIAIRDSVNDIRKGREAVGALWHFIGRLDQEGDSSTTNLGATCGAMRANSEGWNAAFGKLYKKGMSLDYALVKLGMAVVEMQRRVGVASRRSLVPSSDPPNEPSRRKTISRRLFEKERAVTALEPAKPLPRDPDLPDVAHGRPVSGRPRSQRATTKSVPNFRTANKSRRFDEARDVDRTNLPNAADDAEADNAASKSQKGLHKTLPETAHAKGLASKKSENTPTRSATAPARPLKGRSISLEHLKTLCVPRKPQQETMSKSSTSPPQVVTPPGSTRRDNLKDQLLRHARSDKVNEAWENAVNSKKKRPTSRSLQKTKDWPRSIFRAKSTNNRHDSGRQETGLADVLGGKMSWLEEESATLDTYISLKPQPKRAEAPRFHLPSVGVIPESVAEMNVNDHGDRGGDGGAPTESLVTALPPLPRPSEGKSHDGVGRIADSFPQPPSVST